MTIWGQGSSQCISLEIGVGLECSGSTRGLMWLE